MPGKRRGGMPHLSKYQPLADYLATQETDTVRLTFAEFEAILGFSQN